MEVQTAIANVVKASKQKRRNNRYCIVASIDVKDATALHSMVVPDPDVPNYLCKISKSYFQNRVLVYEINQGLRSVRVVAGVSQSPILGPT